MQNELVQLSAAALLLLICNRFACKAMSRLLRVRYFALGLSLSDVVLDFASHGREGSLNILALLGGGLEEAHAVVVGHLEALVERDHTLVLQIGLVANQDTSDVVLGVLLDLAHPGVDGAEGVTVSDIVGHDDAVGALVVARSDSLEALLSSGIPDLKLADFLVNVDGADLEIDTDRGHKVLLELVILQENKAKNGQYDKSLQTNHCQTTTYSESEEKAGLADTRVANHEDLEKVIAAQSNHNRC